MLQDVKVTRVLRVAQPDRSPRSCGSQTWTSRTSRVEYQRWERGEITSPQVAEMHGPQVLEMMQAQYIALAEMDAEQAGQGAAHAERNHGGDRLVEETALDEAAPDGEESVMVIPGDATRGLREC